MELPKIISVDDHVVEPAHVWQTWLPEKHRAAGPHVERKRWGRLRHLKGAKYDMEEDPNGAWGDAWYYEDKLIYVHKKFVAIPQAATTGEGENIEFDRSQMTMTPLTYDEMRPGCYEREARIDDLALELGRRLAPLPHLPAVLRPDLLRGRRQGARSRLRARLQRLDGRGVVRAVAVATTSRSASSRSGTSSSPRPRRCATRSAACRAICFSEMPAPAEAAHDPQRLLGPALPGVQRLGRHRVDAHRLVVDEPDGLARRAEGRERDDRVQQLDGRRSPTGCSRASSSSTRS